MKIISAKRGKTIVGKCSVQGSQSVQPMTGAYERLIDEPYSSIGQNLCADTHKKVTLTLPLTPFTVVRVGYDDLAVSRPRKKKKTGEKTGPVLIPGVQLLTGFEDAQREVLHDDDVLEEPKMGLPTMEDFPELFEVDFCEDGLESLLENALEWVLDEEILL